MSTILMAIAMVGFVALIVIVLMLVHKRDQRKEQERTLHKDFFSHLKEKSETV
ncbi:MAG: hypothetical protein QM737_10845 [Ferruginibacter sp.]